MFAPKVFLFSIKCNKYLVICLSNKKVTSKEKSIGSSAVNSHSAKKTKFMPNSTHSRFANSRSPCLFPLILLLLLLYISVFRALHSLSLQKSLGMVGIIHLKLIETYYIPLKKRSDTVKFIRDTVI